MEYILKESTRKGKKYMLITPDDVKIHFGADGYDDFTTHKDEKRKENYIKRHSATQKQIWKDNVLSPSLLSRFLLWEKADLNAAIKAFELRLGIKIDSQI